MARAIVLRAGADAAARVHLRADLPRPVAIDRAFIAADALTPPASPDPRWEETRRRLSTLEVRWSATAPGFLRLPHGPGQVDGVFQGDVRIDLTNPNQVRAALAARASLAAQIGGKSTERSVTFVLLIDAAVPRLRLDFDDFNLSLPAIDFPVLDLSTGCDLPFGDLSAPFRELAGAFDRLASTLGQTVAVTVTPTSPNPPKLRITASADALT